MFGEYEIYFQLILAVVLGSVIGFERRAAQKRAGPRTFAFVTLGATVFSMISNLVATDPSRIAAQVVVGIGFLGAGLIILREEKGKERLHNLTTAAGLWVAAAIGMAIGFGFYGIAVVTTLLSVFIFMVLWRIERRFIEGIKDK